MAPWKVREKGPRRRVGAAAQCSPGRESLRVEERERKKFTAEERHGVLQRESPCCVSVVRVFIRLLWVGILREVSGEGLSRIFISFPDVSFHVLIH